MKIATIAAGLLFATAMPATAGHYGGGDTNWGAVAGAGILGGILGSALAPQPQPQVIIVQPAPVYVAPPQPAYEQRIWWCEASSIGPRCFSTIRGSHP